ncbi:MAG: NAD(P)/FAD-dependent oxidoreductase [Opitutaceae bacterium]
MKTDIAIIGAGHNGLVAATYLARAGFRVDVFESRSHTGGAMQTEELWPGFRFSTCAHLLHAFSPRVMRDLQLRERGLEVVPRDDVIILRPDGTYDTTPALDLPNHRSARSKLSAEERAGLDRYEAFKQSLFTLAAPFRLRPPPSLSELRSAARGTPAEEPLEMALTRHLWDLQDHFLPTQRLRERHALEFSAVTRDPIGFIFVYNAITQPDTESGERPLNGFVRGGMGELAARIRLAAEDAGVDIHASAPVKRITTRHGVVSGLELTDGQAVESPVVLAATDVKTALLKLLAPDAIDPSIRKRIEGLNSHVSCLKLLAAISELPQWTGWDGDPDLPHCGSVQLEMSRDGVTRAYADLEAGRPAARPMLSFNVPSMRDPSLAPNGGHTASLYVYPAPARLAKGSWDDHREAVADRLIDQITEYAPNFRKSILHHKLRTPLDLEREVGLTDGCIWHIQHNPEQLMFNRPLPELAGYRTPIKGLYLGGSSQHPGGEVTGMPGHNAAHEILKDLGISKNVEP